MFQNRKTTARVGVAEIPRYFKQHSLNEIRISFATQHHKTARENYVSNTSKPPKFWKCLILDRQFLDGILVI